MAIELKLTQTLTGWFDVRVFNERIARKNRQIKGENDNISFTASFAAGDPAAVVFAAFGKPYADANGNPRLRVNFKIGRKCRWFDENANPVSKPANIDLDGKQFEVVMQYNEIAGDPSNPLSPRGYWVDAIQFREAQVNPFSAMVGAAPVPPQPDVVQPQQFQNPQQQAGNVGAPMPPMYGTESTPYTIPSMFDENPERPLPY